MNKTNLNPFPNLTNPADPADNDLAKDEPAKKEPAPKKLAEEEPIQLSPDLCFAADTDKGFTLLNDYPLIILIGLAGVGKTSVCNRLMQEGGYSLLPDRRTLTDRIIIPSVNRLYQHRPEQAGLSPDRVKRFESSYLYRQIHPGGMAYILSKMSIDKGKGKGKISREKTLPGGFSNGPLTPPPSPILIFDGLRGKEETGFALAHFPTALFVVLDAPFIVRLRRLLGRADCFDRVDADKERKGRQSQAAPDADSTGAADAPDTTDAILNRCRNKLDDDTCKLVAQEWQSGCHTVELFRQKLEIVLKEQEYYRSEDAISLLKQEGADRALIFDSHKTGPEEIVAIINTRCLQNSN